jgi:hypothetical protein
MTASTTYRGIKNGIRWFRIGRCGPGLWWRDNRIAGASRADVGGWLLPVGPYRVKVLWLDR